MTAMHTAHISSIDLLVHNTDKGVGRLQLNL